MNKILWAAGLVGLLSTPVQADVIGVYLGGYVWDEQAKGLLGEDTDLIDFNLRDQQQGSYFIALEHPLPLLPNIMFTSTTLDTQGSNQLTDDFQFADKDFVTGTVIKSTFDVSYLDYTLYYELFDNGLFSFDFGLTARDINSDVSAASDAVVAKLSGSEFIPLLYASATVGLPFTGWNVIAQGHFLSFSDHTIHDYQLAVSYELVDNLLIDANLLLGYRSVQLQLDDLDDLSSDIEFDGLYLGAVVHF